MTRLQKLINTSELYGHAKNGILKKVRVRVFWHHCVFSESPLKHVVVFSIFLTWCFFLLNLLL